jgi:serine phosphatase RsbU (regulator of sigma subunit)
VVDRDSVTVVIADVSGKGISAAILASTLQGMIYSQLLSGQPLSQIAQVVNQYICARNIRKYATLVIIRLHANGKAEYINCGHLQPLLCSAGQSTQLTESNLPVGLLPHAVFSSAVTRLKPGTRVLLATDGVTEAENAEGEFFGDDRLRASIHQCATLDEIQNCMRLFCGAAPANDDCTMLEITYRG